MPKTEQRTVTALPNESCRTRYLGSALNLSECLVKSPQQCPHVTTCEQSFFCRHPNSRKFEESVLKPAQPLG